MASALPPGVNPNTIPLSQNPDGSPPNFINPQSLAPTILGTGILLIVISTICIGVRVFTSLKNSHKLRSDDYCAIFGFVCTIGYWAVIYSLAKDGWGRHSWDVPITFINASFTSRQFASQILISPAKFASTSAILILYIRLFWTLKWVRIACYTLWALIFLIQVQNIGVAIQWYAPAPGENLSDVTNELMRTEHTADSAIVNGVCSTVVDIGLFIIPFIVFPTLKLSTQKRRGLYAAFLFGLLIIVADCAGIAYKVYAVLGLYDDPFWTGMIAIITVYCEAFALVIVSCVPALSAFWIGTIMKTQIYLSLQSTIQDRLRRSQKSSAASNNRYKPSYPAPGRQAQPNTMHSSKSLINGEDKNNVELNVVKSNKPTSIV